jgi:hypothetical protein
MVLITPMPQYLCQTAAAIRRGQASTFYRQAQGATQCGGHVSALLFLNAGSACSPHSQPASITCGHITLPVWNRQPCAGNLATREPQVSATRFLRALLCMHSLNYCVCTPNLNLQAPCTSSAKTISAPLIADTGVSSSHEKAKTYTQVIHVGFFDSAGMEILPGARLQSHGWHQHPHRSEPRTAGRPTGQTVWLAVERC